MFLIPPLEHPIKYALTPIKWKIGGLKKEGIGRRERRASLPALAFCRRYTRLPRVPGGTYTRRVFPRAFGQALDTIQKSEEAHNTQNAHAQYEDRPRKRKGRARHHGHRPGSPRRREKTRGQGSNAHRVEWLLSWLGARASFVAVGLVLWTILRERTKGD